jgi:hypothetical protein
MTPEYRAEMTLGRENAQRIALELLRAARSLGEAIVAVEAMGRHEWPEIEADANTADRIVIDGPDVARALRTLAVRLDRCAMERFDEELESGKGDGR